MFVVIQVYLIVLSLITRKNICKTKNKLQKNHSENLVTIVNNPSSLKVRNQCNLHDGVYIPDKIKSLYSPLTTDVNIISAPPKIWRPTSESKYKPINCTDMNEDLFTFKYYGKAMNHVPSLTP